MLRYLDKYFRNTIAKFTSKLYCLSIIRTSDLYIGTDIGVFHKDSTMSEWQIIQQWTAHVSVRELEIQYNIGKIRGNF